MKQHIIRDPARLWNLLGESQRATGHAKERKRPYFLLTVYLSYLKLTRSFSDVGFGSRVHSAEVLSFSLVSGVNLSTRSSA